MNAHQDKEENIMVTSCWYTTYAHKATTQFTCIDGCSLQLLTLLHIWTYTIDKKHEISVKYKGPQSDTNMDLYVKFNFMYMYNYVHSY